MNRRSFLTSLIAGGVGSLILTSASTYIRNWRFQKQLRTIANPEWVTAPYEQQLIFGKINGFLYFTDPVPGRFTYKNGLFVEVTPY